MERMKYVVVSGGFGEYIIVFTSMMQHSDMRQIGNIVSAGFVGHSDMHKCGFYTYGRSTSLNLDSRPEDQILLDMMMKKDW
jgi:hypothetical protein